LNINEAVVAAAAASPTTENNENQLLNSTQIQLFISII
jgi:hypothetical protein